MSTRCLSFVVALLAASLASAPARTQGGAADGYQSLVRLHQDLAAVRQPPTTLGVPDYTAPAMEAQRRALEAARRRLAAIDPESWPVARRIDYLLVRRQLDDLEFRHRVRSWERDPGFYLDLVFRLAYLTLPIPALRIEDFETRLRAIPTILEQARNNLTRGSGEFARLALFRLDHADGVNLLREPFRAVPPEGVIGWFRDLLDRVSKQHPTLIEPARQAVAAFERYRDWLKTREPTMTEAPAIGIEHVNWHLRHVALMPFEASDLLVLAQRERDRAIAFLKIDEHRNRQLPPLQPASTEAELARRVEAAESKIRTFLRDQRLLTVPETIPPVFADAIFWRARPGGKRNFWEEIVHRDPLNIRAHDTVPGHSFDGLVPRAPHPIRATAPGETADPARAEGWAFYVEEMLLQAGLLEDRPRTRELFYIFQLQRAVRVPADVRMQTGEWSLKQAIDYWMAEVPLMEQDLARTELQLFLRNPLRGLNYTIGKIQVERLLADRGRQLGRAFDLGKFHDEFLAGGLIPLSLLRWEMTGLDDEVKGIWEDVRRERVRALR